MNHPRLTAIVLTRNEARHLAPCLASLAWADAVLVVDSGSVDATAEIARGFKATWVSHPFENFSTQRNAAMGLAQTPWVLFVDADERVPPALAEEIRATLAAPDASGYWIPRENVFWGHRMRGGGWWPDPQLRLLRAAQARYDPARAVHEVPEIAGPTAYLSQGLVHLNYATPGEMWSKQGQYAPLDARRRHAEGWRWRRRQYVSLPLREFWRRYVTLAGWRDGPTGLLACSLMAAYEVLVLGHLAQDAWPTGVDEPS